MSSKRTINPNLFLSYKFKPAGYLLVLSGFFLLILRFYFDWKPDFLETKTFAVYSTYIDTSYLSIIENNLIEEAGGFLVFVGLAFLFFSKEKSEESDYNNLRYKALIISQFLFFVFLIFSIVFVYGIAFIKVALISLIFPSVIYLILFKYFLHNHKKISKNS